MFEAERSNVIVAPSVSAVTAGTEPLMVGLVNVLPERVCVSVVPTMVPLGALDDGIAETSAAVIEIFAEPSKETPAIVRAFCSAVAVAALPVVL